MRTSISLLFLLIAFGLSAQKNLYVAKTGKTYGYINEHCEWVVPAKYDRVFPLDSTVGVILHQDKHGLVSSSGEMIMEVKYEYLKAGGGMVMFRSNELYGYYNYEGEKVINARYTKAKLFKNKRAIVLKRDQWIFIDFEGNEFIVGKDMKLHNYSEGRALIFDKIKDRFGYIDLEGKWVVDPKFNKAKDFHEGFARVLVGDKWGFIRTNGDWLVEPKYSNAFDFQEGHARVLTENGYTFLNADGSEMELGKVDKIHDFTEGVARVIRGKDVGLIDTEGNWLVEPSFESIKPKIRGYIPAAKKGLWGFIDEKGNWIIEPNYKNVAYPSEGLIPVMFKKLWGFIDENGKIVIEPAYNNLYELPPMGISSYMILKQPLFQNGIARAKEGKQWVLIDLQGQKICAQPLDYIGKAMPVDGKEIK